jgi:tetratricopeptide (TPR) repeat protein
VGPVVGDEQAPAASTGDGQVGVADATPTQSIPVADAPQPSTGSVGPASEPAPAAAVARSGDRTGDGIDDENWLPRADTPAFMAFQGAVELARKDPALAVDAFVAAARKTDGFYAAWFNAGTAAEQVGRGAEAEAHYRKSLEVRGDYGLALTNLASLLARTGREAEAAQVIADAQRRFPEKAGPHVAAAQRALDRGDLAAAEAAARTAMKFDERNVPAMSVMAHVFHAQGRLETARFAIDNALALEPGNALLQLERGRILLEQQEKKLALLAFERAARLRPSLAEAQESYGLALLDQGFAPEAEAAFSALTRLEPRQAAAQLHLGNALRANKKYPASEVAYRAALGLDPNLHDARFNLALLYVDNPLPGIDELPRLQKAVDELTAYRDGAKPDGVLKKRVDDYIDSTEKRIAKERKRREREEKRKAEDAKKAAEPPPAPTAAGDAPQQPSTGSVESAPAPPPGAADAASPPGDSTANGAPPPPASPASGEPPASPASGEPTGPAAAQGATDDK